MRLCKFVAAIFMFTLPASTFLEGSSTKDGVVVTEKVRKNGTPDVAPVASTATNEKEEAPKKPLPETVSILTEEEMDAIVKNMYKSLASTNDQFTPAQITGMMKAVLNISSVLKKKGRDEAAAYFLPTTYTHYSDPMIRKLNAMMFDATNPTPEEMSELHVTFDGFLQVAKGLTIKPLVGRVENGVVRLSSYFNLAGPPIKDFVQKLLFPCQAPKRSGGRIASCSWNEVYPIAMSESRNTSLLKGVFLSKKELDICNPDTTLGSYLGATSALKCHEWPTFQKHLRGCRMKNMELCIDSAKKSPVVKEILERFWEYETKRMRFFLEDSVDSSRNLETKTDKLLVEINPHLDSFRPEFLISRFNTKEEFSADESVQGNFLWFLVLGELVRRDVYRTGKEYFGDENTQKGFIEKMLGDLVGLFAKAKMIADGNSFVVTRGLTGDSLSRRASLIIKSMIDKKEAENNLENSAKKIKEMMLKIHRQKVAKVQDLIIERDIKEPSKSFAVQRAARENPNHPDRVGEGQYEKINGKWVKQEGPTSNENVVRESSDNKVGDLRRPTIDPSALKRRPSVSEGEGDRR